MECLQIKLSDIVVHDNTRAKEVVTELMKSIKQDGLISPITVCPNFINKTRPYILVAGHRRFAAVSKLGHENILAAITTVVTDKKQLLLHNLTENLQREDVSPTEDGRYFFILQKDFDMTAPEIAVRLSISKSYVDQAMKAYMEVPAKYRDVIIKAGDKRKIVNKIPLSLANKILTATRAAKMPRAARNRLFAMAAKNLISETKVGLICSQYDVSKPITDNFQRATKTIDDTMYCRFDVLLKRREVKKLYDKYGVSISEIIKKAVFGEIKLNMTRP